MREEPSVEFPPHALRDYALLADGERGALIGPRGDLAWLCLPAWDSDAAFSTLIGGSGYYAVTPGRSVYLGWLLRLPDRLYGTVGGSQRAALSRAAKRLLFRATSTRPSSSVGSRSLKASSGYASCSMFEPGSASMRCTVPTATRMASGRDGPEP